MILTRSVPVDLRAAEVVKHLGQIANYAEQTSLAFDSVWLAPPGTL